ncbi:hypothetical protein [Actinomadura harenae]
MLPVITLPDAKLPVGALGRVTGACPDALEGPEADAGAAVGACSAALPQTSQ